MDIMTIWSTISNSFLKGVHTEFFNDRDNGGPECAKYMSLEFKLGCTVMMIIIYSVIYKITKKYLELEIVNEAKPYESPSIFERFLGYSSILMFIVQCLYKINSEQLIFIFNPCHFLLLIQGYLFIVPNTLTSRTIYTVVINTLFSPWIAIAFPVTCGLDAFFEIPMFWIEHFMSALVNPLVLSLSHRYYTKNTISVRNHIFAHIIFGFYQRIVLFPLSQLTHANLNFTLCPSIKDPFEPIMDKWYYLVSEIYIFIGGEIFHRIVKLMLDNIIKLEKLIFKRSGEYEIDKKE